MYFCSTFSQQIFQIIDYKYCSYFSRKNEWGGGIILSGNVQKTNHIKTELPSLHLFFFYCTTGCLKGRITGDYRVYNRRLQGV